VKRAPSFCVALVAVLSLAAPSVRAQSTDGKAGPAAPTMTKPAIQPFSRDLAPELQNAVRPVTLPALDVAVLKAEDSARAATGDKSMRVGAPRDLRVQLTDGRWDRLPGRGWLWRAEVVSPGAYAIRVHFSLMNLPDGARLLYFAPRYVDKIYGPISNRGPLKDGDFWSQPVVGDRMRIEYLVPGDEDQPPTGAPFMIDQLIHEYRSPLGDAGDIIPKEGNCHNDVTCYPAWASLSHAVARIDYVDAGSGYTCTGQLLNDQCGDLTPYFLTANHCINNAGAANSALIYWDYQTSVCNGIPPALNTVPTSSYCTLLSNNANSDYSLLMVEGTLPGGRYWSGWTSGTPTDGTAVAGIHHPTGAYKRISFGNKGASSLANHIRSNWYSGVTEPGSSGSGLFRQDNQQLTGQLHGGPSVCGGTMLYDDYGAFAVTYPQISGYMACGSDDAFYPNTTCGAAAVVGSGDWFGLVVRYANDDWYSVNVPAGQRITVTINFTNAWGDIDMAMYDACGGSLVASSTGTGDSEQIDYENPGGATDFKIHVYLYSDTRNYYDLHVVVAPFPNLQANVTPPGFSSPAVPRDLNNSAFNNAPLTPTLEGNTNNTYLNWAIYNAGPGNTPQGWESRLVVDEDPGYFWFFDVGPNNPGNFTWETLNNGPNVVRGGRHSLTNYADYFDNVIESTKADNTWRGQWVWSPLVTTKAVPLVRAHPPVTDNAYFGDPNEDGFQFSRTPGYAWVMAIAGTGASDDYDLYLYSDYSGSSSGFSSVLTSSLYSGNLTDFVVGNFSGTPVTMYPAAVRYDPAGGTGDYAIDQTDAAGRNAAGQASYYYQDLSPNRLADVYEAYLTSGVTYYWMLYRNSGTSHVAFNIYSPLSGTMNGRGGALAYSSFVDDAHEIMSFVPGTTGWHPIVVYRNNGINANTDLVYSLLWNTSPIVAVDSQTPPLTLEFLAPVPNPLVTSTRLEFAMPEAGRARLALFDLQGRQVRSLVDGSVEAGRHSLSWDARDDNGTHVGAGLYWARLEAGGRTFIRRLTVLH